MTIVGNSVRLDGITGNLLKGTSVETRSQRAPSHQIYPPIEPFSLTTSRVVHTTIPGKAALLRTELPYNQEGKKEKRMGSTYLRTTWKTYHKS